MPKEYVTQLDGVYQQVGHTRVSLDSLVYLFREGMSAESMVEGNPALTLKQVHGALAFYLANQKAINAYLLEGQSAAESLHTQSRQNQRGINREAPARAACESDSRLMPSLEPFLT